MVRVFCLREQLFKLGQKLLGWENGPNDDLIAGELNNNDSLHYPVLNKGGHVHFRYPASSLDDEDICNSSTLLLPIRVVLQCVQSCMLLLLSAVELLETIPSFFVDLLCDRSFTSAKNNFKKSGHLAYASIRNLITPMSKFDQPVIAFLEIPNKQMCNA